MCDRRSNKSAVMNSEYGEGGRGRSYKLGVQKSDNRKGIKEMIMVLLAALYFL
jgi:hypothetical protein